MAQNPNNMDLGDFESKVDQMAAMLNQLQEAGRQNEAVNKLKQLMSTLVKVCPESATAPPAVDGTGDHVDTEDELQDNPQSIAKSIVDELVDRTVEGPTCILKTKRSAKSRACKVSAAEKNGAKPGSLAKRRRGRPPKYPQRSTKAEKAARRKELSENRQKNSAGGQNRLGRKRKNPNPQKLSVDDSDDDANFGDTQEQEAVNLVCDKCTKLNTKSISKYIRHMRLHGEALLSCMSCQKPMYCTEEFQRHQCAKVPPAKKRQATCTCNVCAATFSSKKKYKEHMKTEHSATADAVESENRPHLKCPYCEKMFTRKVSMFNHYKEHAGERWVCQTCGDFCQDFNAYSDHMAQHARDAKFNCEKCGLSFQRKQQYEQHVLAHAKYDCHDCKRNFSTKKDLQRHERNEHGSKVPWEHKYHECDICGKSYPRPGMLEIHRRIHTGEKPLECTACRMFFRTPKALSKHRQTFTHMQRSGSIGKERRYLCSLCGNAYFRRQALLRHQKYHTGEKPFKCPHCEYRCPEANNLKRHMLLHFSSQRSFMCEICGASFHAKKTLEMHHIYKHSEDRQYPCSECSMSFKAANALRRHLRSHSTDKPFACWCGASFNRQYNLRRHMRSVHGVDDTLPPVRKVAVLDTPPEELAAKAEAEKDITKMKGKRARKVKPYGAPSARTVPQVQPVQTVSVETHPQHIVIAAPQGQTAQITTEMTDQEIQQHVMATLPRVIDEASIINTHLQHQEVHIQHVQLHEVHVQHPEMDTNPQTAPTHVIVSAQDSHNMASSPVTRPMSVPHPGYGVTSTHQQWHMPIVMQSQVITSQGLPLEQEQQQQQHQQPQQHHMTRSDTPTSQHSLVSVHHMTRSDTPTSQHSLVSVHHMTRSDTPTSQHSLVSVPLATRQVRPGLVAGAHLVQERPMSHPSAQSVPHHHQQQMTTVSHVHQPHPQHHQQSAHLQATHHITYPEVTYAEGQTKQMVLIPSIAPGTEVVSAQEEQFLAKAEQAAIENMAQYQPGSTGYTGLPILLHQINTSN